MAEETNIEQSKSKPMTDKELEELLRKSEQNASYPDVPFDEFTVPTPDMKALPSIPFTRCVNGKTSCRRMIIRAWATSCAAVR